MSMASKLKELLESNSNSEQQQQQQINKNSIYQEQYNEHGVQIERAVRE